MIGILLFRITNQLLRVSYDEIHLHHLLKQLIMKIKRKSIYIYLKFCLICFLIRPLDLAKKTQMSPSIIDILFSLSGRL
jgi:hypothetical protein